MVKDNNLKPIQQQKPFETVQELKDKYEIPSWEEFAKNYESNGDLNYDDLNNNNLGVPKGYGPCRSCSGSNRSKEFELRIHLKNCLGDYKKMTVYNTENAKSEATRINQETDFWKDSFLTCFSQEDRQKLYGRIYEKINEHNRGNDVNTTVCNKDESSSSGSRGYENQDQVETMNYWQFGPGSYSG